MRRVLAQPRTTKAMLDYLGRKNHAVTSVGDQPAHHEIFSQIVFQPLEAANRFERAPPRGYRCAYRKLHAFEHPCHQNAGQEICIQTRRLEM